MVEVVMHDEMGHRRHEEEDLPDFLARSLLAVAVISAVLCSGA